MALSTEVVWCACADSGSVQLCSEQRQTLSNRLLSRPDTTPTTSYAHVQCSISLDSLFGINKSSYTLRLWQMPAEKSKTVKRCMVDLWFPGRTTDYLM